MKPSRRTVLLLSLVAGLASRSKDAATAANIKESRMSPLRNIRQLDYTVIFARDMDAMRRFYGEVMEFPVYNELGRSWIAYRIGASLLALTERGGMFNDPPPPKSALSVQLAFRVAPAEVYGCAEALKSRNVAIISGPTDQLWGHRTLFFRDPDGNVLEIYADI